MRGSKCKVTLKGGIKLVCSCGSEQFYPVQKGKMDVLACAKCSAAHTIN